MSFEPPSVSRMSGGHPPLFCSLPCAVRLVRLLDASCLATSPAQTGYPVRTEKGETYPLQSTTPPSSLYLRNVSPDAIGIPCSLSG